MTTYWMTNTNPCPTCSTDPIVNPSLLTSNQTTAWWVSDSSDPPDIDSASVVCTLYFYNGEPPLTVSANGLFNMYRPNSEVTTITGVTAADYNSYYDPFALHYGDPDYFGVHGITF